MPDTENDIQVLVQELADKGLVKYLEDADLQGMAAKYLAEELKLPPLAVRTGLKFLAPLVVFGARKSGTWFARIGGRKLKELAFKVPGMAAARDKIGLLLEKLDSERAAKREADEILAGKRPPGSQELGNHLSQDMQAHLKALEKQDQIIDSLADLRDALERLANPQPTLRLFLPDPEPENRFVYNSSLAPFLGRKEEMRTLKRFLDSEVDFSWWLIHGPGGLGKSRLALELCRAHGGLWRAGFLKTGKAFDWDKWQPEQPTLMIVDYAAAAPEKIHEIALALAERDDLEWPVRLLLLERDAGDWYDRRFLGTGSERASVEQSRSDNPLLLQPLEEEAVRELIRFYLEKPVEDNALDDLFAALKEIDDPPRPLFAAFAADAFNDGKNPRGWNKQRLITDVLNREEDKYWRPKGVTDKDKRLLALATMCGGVAPDKVRELPDKDFFLDDDHIPAKRYKAMIGRPASDKLPALEPDILGEMFVLNLLNGDEAKANCWDETFHRNAWQISPAGAWTFLDQLSKDFLVDTIDNKLFAPAAEDARRRGAWVMLAINLINEWSRLGNIKKAEIVYNQLEKLANSHPCESKIQRNMAKGAHNLIIALIEDKHIEKAQNLYSQLSKQVYCNDVTEINQIRFGSAKNLILAWGDAGKPEMAQLVYDKTISSDAIRHDEPEIRLLTADNAINLINIWANAGKPQYAQNAYEQLVTLADQYHDDPQIKLRQAQGAYNLVLTWSETGNPEKLQEVYNQLGELTVLPQHESELGLIKANTAKHVILAWGEAGKLEKAQIIYDQLANIADKYDDDPEIRKAQVIGALTLIIMWIEAGGPENAHDIYAQLIHTLIHYKHRLGLEINLTEIAINIICAWGESGALEKAVEIHNLLLVFTSKYHDNTKMQQILSASMLLLALFHHNANQLDNAVGWYKCGLTQALKYPDDRIMGYYNKYRHYFVTTP